ncbi:hypothetical protein MTO96_021786 [Rhipicephalus appendiculatus]
MATGDLRGALGRLEMVARACVLEEMSVSSEWTSAITDGDDGPRGASNLENKGDVLTATVVLDSSTDSRITSDAGNETGGLALQARDSLKMERDHRLDHSTDLDESFGIRLPVLDEHDNSMLAVVGPSQEYDSAGWGRSKSLEERSSPESLNYLYKGYY